MPNGEERIEREALRRTSREATRILREDDVPKPLTVAERITQEVEWEVWR